MTILFGLSSLASLLAIVGLFNPKLVIRRSSMQTKAKAFFLWAIASVTFFTAGTMIADIAAQKERNEAVSAPVEYYVGSRGANIRECPEISCKIMDTISPYTKLTFKSDPFSENPEWARYVFSDGSAGYVSKAALSNNPTYTGQSESGGGSSSIGGIVVGPWSNIQAEVGGSYEFHFCEPESAISGATCGGLADTATNPTGGRPPYSFFKKSGFLPPGMALELNGIFSGSPTQAGTFNFRLCAKDLYGGEGCQNLAVAVADGGGYYVDNDEAPPISLSPPSEEVSASVSLTSVSCTRIGTNDTKPVYRLEYSGTASSPIDFYLDIDANPFCVFGNAFPNTPDPYFISNWTPNSKDGWRLDRKAGDPETTSWTWINEGFCYRGDVKASVAIRDNEYHNPKANSGTTIVRCP